MAKNYGSTSTPEDVAKNISAVRMAHPKLPIKLNVVAGPANSDRISILRYVEFAIQSRLELNVYRESTVGSLVLISGRESKRQVTTKWWDVEALGGTLLEATESRSIYDLYGARINLSRTSTDSPRWSSIWVSPKATAYVDILHRTPDVPLKAALSSKTREMLRLILFNLSIEATIHRMEDKGTEPILVPAMLGDVVAHRCTLLTHLN